MPITIICFKMCSAYMLFLNILLILLAPKDCVGIGELNSPDIEFSKYSVVQPTVHHARTKRELPSTRHANGAHHLEVQLTVPIDGEPWVLELRLNEDLVPGGHTLQYQEGGKTVKHRPKKEELELCHYSGSVRGKPQSWVAVSTCRGVRGVIFDGQRMRYIEPAQGTEIKTLHYLYDHYDLITERSQSSRSNHVQPTTAHSTGDKSNKTVYDRELSTKYHGEMESKNRWATRYKRETNRQVREPYNANKLSRYLELVLVADHREFRANGRDVRAVHTQFIQLANIINSMFAPLNIFIALVGVEVWSERDKIRIDEKDDGLQALRDFLKYREQTLIIDIPHDNAHLLTHQKFYGGVVGKSMPFSMCKLQSSGGVAVNFTKVIGLEAATIAHEIGHNFGMKHDEICEISNCPDEKCIMSETSSSVIPLRWSSCSLNTLEQSFKKGLDYCLHNKPNRLFESPTCGNGFIEPGEQCDCGITAGGSINPCHACCHPDTCMLRANATCGAGACCDLTSCRPKSAGAVCRAAERECDLPEHCTGHSEFCPADVYKMDSTPCGVGEKQAYCMKGSCRSHTDQCQLLWGAREDVRTHPECYTENTKGYLKGNCGYDPVTQVYKACGSADALCGLLQCHTENNWLEHAMGYGTDAGSEVNIFSYVRNRVRFDCFTAKFNLGENDDLGYVQDGAKCGHERMCLKQRCVRVEAVREAIAARDSAVCPSNCSGHGLCNSEGHCHCDAGFAPPLCAEHGPGGSVESGPATKPSGGSINSRPNKIPGGGSVNSRPNINHSGGTVNSRPNINPSGGSVNSRPKIKPSGSFINARPNIVPISGSVNSRPNIVPSGGSVNSRPNNRPSDVSVYSRPNIKPSDGSGNFRPKNKPNDGSVNSRPYIKPNGNSGNFRPKIEPSGGLVNIRPNIVPSDGSVNFRPNIIPNSGSANFRPIINPSNGFVNARPNIKPGGDSGNFRPNIKPSGGLISTGPNIKPSGGSVNSTPNITLSSGSVNFRPNMFPSGGSGNFRPNNKPSGGFISSKPNIKPSGGSVNFRPNIEPSGGSVNYRPNIKPSGGSGNFRPNINPSGDFINSRPNIKPNGGSVNSRPNIKPNGGSVNSRPKIKPSGGSANSRPNIRPSGGVFVDSGPLTEPRTTTTTKTTKTTEQRNFTIAMYVMFLGTVPAAILLFLIYYTRHNAFWRQSKSLYVNYFACCTKNYCKYSNKINTKITGLDNVNEDDKNVAEKELKKPIKKITKGDIHIIKSNDVQLNAEGPLLQITKDAIQIPIDEDKLKPVKPMPEINKNNIPIAENDVTMWNPVLNIKINDIQTANNNAEIKSVSPNIAKEDIMLTYNAELKPGGDGDIQAAITNVKLKPARLKSKIDNNEVQLATHNIKLKPVKLMSKTGKDDIQIEFNDVKLKPVKPMSKTDKDGIQINFNDVKLKPVKPMLKTDTHTPNYVKLKPVKQVSKNYK